MGELQQEPVVYVYETVKSKESYVLREEMGGTGEQHVK